MKNEGTTPKIYEADQEPRAVVSNAVIRRLPRYYRYLRELIRRGENRISSLDLAKLMNVTASQIRQDLNCFGGFGQQGYGYNIHYLYAKICELLGVGEGYHAVVIGAGNLGRALVNSPMFERRGIDVIGIFDIYDKIIGTSIADIEIYHINTLEQFCKQNQVDIAVLTLPKSGMDEVVSRLVSCGVPSIWNFTGKECEVDPSVTIVEDIHIGDSLMTLCYELRERNIAQKERT